MCFTEIEAMSSRFKVFVTQFDHQVTDCRRYHRGDWSKIDIKGRGGTCFVNAINWIKENQMVGKVNIVLTDGEAPWPEPEPFETIWVIVRNPKIVPPWGQTIHIKDYK
jgi:predicted metal-dependent peptidase